MSKKYTREEIENMEDQTDYKRLEEMTEEEIEENSETDEDCKTPTDEMMKKFNKVKKDER